MDSLNTLKNVLHKLKREEIRSLINFLKYHQKELKDQPMKSIQLVEMLLSDKNYTSSDLQLTLYGKVNYQAFNKLVNRLKDKAYEILLFNSNLVDSDNYGKRNKTVFDLKKKLLQSEVMFSRGMNDELEKIQNKIISTAKQYEIYDSLIEALKSKQRYIGFRLGAGANKKIKNEIDFYEKSRIIYSRALDIYNSISSKINFSISYEEYEVELNEALEMLQSDFKLTGSASVGYYYFLLLTEHYQNKLEYKNSQHSLIQLKELLEGNVSIYTKYRIGTTIINISNNELLMYDFDSCMLHARESLVYFSDSIVNRGIAQEIEFYGLFYSGKFSIAEKMMEELYHSSRISNTPFLYSKRAYLFACMKSIKGENLQSNELLEEVTEIEKDKEGWNIAKRILTIINRIETKDFESVDLQVQNLQKHIKRTLKTKQVSKRNILILRILVKLINEHFDFAKVYKNRQRYFELIESSEIDYRWKIKSPELIIFHEWFKSKMENRPYNHSLATDFH